MRISFDKMRIEVKDDDIETLRSCSEGRVCHLHCRSSDNWISVQHAQERAVVYIKGLQQQEVTD
jgi:hypothetical protein